DWSLSEWIANFLKDDDQYYDDEALYSDYMDDTMDVGGEEDFLDAGGVLESVLIIGVTMSLVLLLWYRQRMQQAHGQAQADNNIAGHEQANPAARRQPGDGPGLQPPAAAAAAGGNPANPFDGLAGWAGGGMLSRSNGGGGRAVVAER
ncbi:hypothetical protein E4U53_002671, partial [Claviceps sorghi]